MRTIALGSAMLLLMACGGSTPARTQYLLRADNPERTLRVASPARVGIARVSIAPYLHQSGIVVETETGEVRPAHHHRWAEPLEDGLLLFLRTELSTALGVEVGIDRAMRSQWEYAVRIFVEELHGTMSGRAVLVASFRIERQGANPETAAYRFVRSRALGDEGYDALVAAQRDLGRELARSMADGLRELGLAP